MEFYPTQEVTFSGDKRARLFRSMALSRLRSLVSEMSFNNLPQLQREVEVLPGFSILVGSVYGSRFAHVHLESSVAADVTKFFNMDNAKIKSLQKITINSATWVAGAGNPPFPRANQNSFLVGDVLTLKATGGPSGQPLEFTPYVGTSAVTVGAPVLISSGVYQVTVTVIAEALFGIEVTQEGSADFEPAPAVRLTWNTTDNAPQIDIAKIKQPFITCYSCAFVFRYQDPTKPIVDSLNFIPILKRGGNYWWDVVSFDTRYISSASFRVTGSGDLIVEYFPIMDCTYGLTYVTVKVTEEFGGVELESAPLTITIVRKAPWHQDLYSGTSVGDELLNSTQAACYSEQAPVTWGFEGPVSGLSLTYGVNGYNPSSHLFVNEVGHGPGSYSNGGYLVATGSCGGKVYYPLSLFGIPKNNPIPPLTITRVSQSRITISGGTQLPAGGYTYQVYPPNSTGGVGFMAPNATTIDMYGSGCFCEGAGIKVTDNAGETAFIPFTLNYYGPSLKCTSGCNGGGSTGGGGGGGGTWYKVYDGSLGSCSWVCAPMGSGFEGCNKYTSVSNDGLFTLDWGYGAGVYDGQACSWYAAIPEWAGITMYEYSFNGMNDAFYRWCVANGKTSQFRILSEADFAMVPSNELPAGVKYHCAVLSFRS